MRCGYKYLSSLLLAVAFLAPALTTGCGGGYRVYDPYYNDYHRWNGHETVYYNRWVTENHRENRDFRKLDRDDQKQYWTWRHGHDDHHDDHHH